MSTPLYMVYSELGRYPLEIYEMQNDWILVQTDFEKIRKIIISGVSNVIISL